MYIVSRLCSGFSWKVDHRALIVPFELNILSRIGRAVIQHWETSSEVLAFKIKPPSLSPTSIYQIPLSSSSINSIRAPSNESLNIPKYSAEVSKTKGAFTFNINRPNSACLVLQLQFHSSTASIESSNVPKYSAKFPKSKDHHLPLSSIYQIPLFQQLQLHSTEQ